MFKGMNVLKNGQIELEKFDKKINVFLVRYELTSFLLRSTLLTNFSKQPVTLRVCSVVKLVNAP